HPRLTRLREAGMALEAVQAQAGHASIEAGPGLSAAGQRLAGWPGPACGRVGRCWYRSGRRDAGRARGRSPVSALPAHERPSPGWHAEAEWAQIAAVALARTRNHRSGK